MKALVADHQVLVVKTLTTSQPITIEKEQRVARFQVDLRVLNQWIPMVITTGKGLDRCLDQYQGQDQDQVPNRLPDPGRHLPDQGLPPQVHNTLKKVGASFEYSISLR